jgi:drug/metabolite transporter (DMT)-like permease
LSYSKKLKLFGFSSLILTTFLWGTSFAFIKLSVGVISPYTYVFTRTLLASIMLLPLVALKALSGPIDYTSLKRGFIVGLAYSTGLVLQGAGTAYIDPSTSAFITGLSTLHVHLYSSLIKRRYSWIDGAALFVALLGLYTISTPSGGLGVGELLVLAGTFMWALQVILISQYSYSSMLEFLFGTFLAGTIYGVATPFTGLHMATETWLYIAYLALVCSIGATFFQVLGQRYVSEATAAIVFLLEPVFATIFSVAMGLETVTTYKVVGGALILSSLYLALYSEFKTR